MNNITPPDPTKAAQWAGQIRALLTLLAGAGIVGGAWAGVSVEQLTNWVTLAMWATAGAGAAWASYKSWQDKIKQRQEKVATAMVSAQNGTPLIVSVTPPGVENTVARVSVAEQDAAPTVPMGAVVQPPPITI